MGRHRHVWQFAQYRVGRTTTGVSGRGRTLPHWRQCACGASERRVYNGRTSRWMPAWCTGSPAAVYACLLQYQRDGYRLELTHPMRPTVEFTLVDTVAKKGA